MTRAADVTSAEAPPNSQRWSPLDPESPLSPHGQAVAITQLVYATAECHVGVAAAHRIAASVFEQLEVHR